MADAANTANSIIRMFQAFSVGKGDLGYSSVLSADGPRAFNKGVSDSRTHKEGRMAFDKGAWSEAYALLGAADARAPLDPDDLDRLATAAYLIGEDSTSVQTRTRAGVVHGIRSGVLLAQFSVFGSRGTKPAWCRVNPGCTLSGCTSSTRSRRT